MNYSLYKNQNSKENHLLYSFKNSRFHQFNKRSVVNSSINSESEHNSRIFNLASTSELSPRDDYKHTVVERLTLTTNIINCFHETLSFVLHKNHSSVCTTRPFVTNILNLKNDPLLLSDSLWTIQFYCKKNYRIARSSNIEV